MAGPPNDQPESRRDTNPDDNLTQHDAEQLLNFANASANANPNPQTDVNADYQDYIPANLGANLFGSTDPNEITFGTGYGNQYWPHQNDPFFDESQYDDTTLNRLAGLAEASDVGLGDTGSNSRPSAVLTSHGSNYNEEWQLSLDRGRQIVNGIADDHLQSTFDRLARSLRPSGSDFDQHAQDVAGTNLLDPTQTGDHQPTDDSLNQNIYSRQLDQSTGNQTAAVASPVETQPVGNSGTPASYTPRKRGRKAKTSVAQAGIAQANETKKKERKQPVDTGLVPHSGLNFLYQLGLFTIPGEPVPNPVQRSLDWLGDMTGTSRPNMAHKKTAELKKNFGVKEWEKVQAELQEKFKLNKPPHHKVSEHFTNRLKDNPPEDFRPPAGDFDNCDGYWPLNDLRPKRDGGPSLWREPDGTFTTTRPPNARMPVLNLQYLRKCQREHDGVVDSGEGRTDGEDLHHSKNAKPATNELGQNAFGNSQGLQADPPTHLGPNHGNAVPQIPSSRMPPPHPVSAPPRSILNTGTMQAPSPSATTSQNNQATGSRKRSRADSQDDNDVQVARDSQYPRPHKKSKQSNSVRADPGIRRRQREMERLIAEKQYQHHQAQNEIDECDEKFRRMQHDHFQERNRYVTWQQELNNEMVALRQELVNLQSAPTPQTGLQAEETVNANERTEQQTTTEHADTQQTADQGNRLNSDEAVDPDDVEEEEES